MSGCASAHKPIRKTTITALVLFTSLLAAMPLIVLPNAHPTGFIDDIGTVGGPIPSVDGLRTRAGSPPPTIDHLQYAAIGPLEFREIMVPLLEWKTQKGVRSEYFPMDGPSGFLADQPGRDTEEKVRDFIKSLKAVNPDLTWVLLVGDGEIIPPRNTFVNGTAENGGDDPENYVLSDLYYAGLDGNWDLVENSVFGEETEQDWFANVYVGRFPASNREELRTMVDRQLSYEIDPAPGSWTSSMLLAGSLMDRPNVPNKPGTIVDEGYDAYKDNAYELVTKVRSDLPSFVTPLELYDYKQVDYGGYNQLFDILNESTFSSYFDVGFSTMLLACHGDSNGNCSDYKGIGGGNLPYWLDYEVYFDYTMAETKRNGGRLPFVYISSCASLNFSERDDTNMERIMRNRFGGAIGIIGASVDTFRGEYAPEENFSSSYGNWWLAREFFRLLYHGTPRPGEALYQQKENYINHVFSERPYSIEEFRMFYIDNLAYSLLGDPEGPIWLDEPRTLNVTLPDPYFQDNQTFIATISDLGTGAPMKDALVSITDPNNGSLLLIGRSGPDGRVGIGFHPIVLGKLTVTVTKEGYLPYIGEVQVVSQKNLEIIPPIELDPEPPVYGQPVVVSVRITNSGMVNFSRVLLTLKMEGWIGNKQMSQQVDRLIDSMRTGEVRKIDLTLSPYEDVNTVICSANLLDGSMEMDFSDNIHTSTFKANEPIKVKDIPTFEIPEDTPLSMTGQARSISNYILDLDNYPSEINASAEVLSGLVSASVGKELLLEVVPEQDWYGTSLIRIHASDGGSTAYTDMVVEVAPVPDPPEFSWVPNYLEGLEDEKMQFSVNLFDVDSSIISLSSDLSDLNITGARNGTMHLFNISFSPGDSMVGDTVLTLTARDESNLSTEVNINLHVNQSNDPPAISPMEPIEIEQGSDLILDLEVIDPEGDDAFRVYVDWRFGDHSFNSTRLTIPVPRDAKKGDYQMEIWVDDGKENGNSSISLTVKVVGSTEERSTIYFVIIIILLVGVLISYGVLIRVQEMKRKKILDKVGTDSPLEVRTITEKDFIEKRSRKGRTGTIEAPPAPSHVEGPLARKEMSSKDRPEGAPPSDLEGDLDEVITEMFQEK